MKQKNIEIRTHNRAEIQVCEVLEKQGYEVIKNGWPDFVAINWETREVRFIEVKPLGLDLKPRQKRMKKIFELLGLKYEVIHSYESGVNKRKK